jgi:hypothetical protein
MEIARGMSDAYGEHSVGGEVLSTMERRTLTGGVTETNMVGVLRKVLKEFHEKRAGDDLVLRVLADPAMNRTEEFALKPGELLPKGWTMYRPRPGLPGWKIPEADAHFAAGVADHLGADAKSLVPGSFVIPEDMAQRLENFYPEHPRPGVESTVYKMGRATARAFTVYNPANTAMNLVSDFGLATLGLPGEKNNLRGFLRFYPQALGESIKGAFGGNSALYERGVQEGLGSATYIEATGGAQVPASLAEALGETPSKNPFSHAANVLRRSRMAVEMAPRLAAGMAAEARTGAASEFGRVGRNITLPYGAGAPEHTRSPFFRFAAPFMQFIGLATDRTAKLLTMKGSRGRAWAAVVAVPTAAFMWNRQNQAFRDVEMSLNKRDRYTMHVIVPGEDGAPAHDVNGKPIVLRFRYFVPEEVAGMFGLSNIPARVADLVEGRATVGDLAASSAATAIEQAGSQVVPAQIAVGLATGRNLQTGQAVPRAEIAANAIPIVRQGLEAVKQTENEGVVGGIKSLVEGASAVRFDTPVKKGRADADIEDLKVKLKDERTMMRSSFRKGDRATGMQHQRNIYKIANRIRAINAARRKGRSKR